MRHPQVSVVLPCYNAAGTLEASLGSLAGQAFGDWECLCIDDGSTDESPALLDRWARRDNRFVVLRQEHGGIVSALNRGLAAARGTLVARMDADDMARPERLGEQVARLEREPDLGVVSCLVEEQPAGATGEGFARYLRWTNTIVSPEDHRLNRFVEAPVIHPTVTFRRELVDRRGGYREVPPWPEDFELWLRWLHHGVRFAKVPRVLYEWRDRPGRLSRTGGRYAEEAFYACKLHYLALGPLRGHRRVGVWGAGRVTRKRMEPLEDAGIEVAFYVDIDPRKIGRPVGGTPVLAPEELAGAPDVPLLACVGSRGAREAIRAALAGSRYREGVDFWCLA
jgi:glycosyltransferase involved in cell wall biosynthesis